MKNLSFIPNTFIFGTQDIFDEIQELSDPDSSGVVVPGEVGILLIHTPNFFCTARERMNDLYHKE